MKKILAITSIFILMLTMSGCAKTILYTDYYKKIVLPSIETSPYIVSANKNYTLKKKTVTTIGDSIIRTSKIHLLPRKETILSFKASKSFAIYDTQFNADDKFKIIGLSVINNKDYRVVQHHKLPFYIGILIDETGVLQRHMVVSIHNTFNFTIINLKNTDTPADVHIYEVKDTKYLTPLVQKNFTYELIYQGIDNGTLRILYREYTKDDMARPSFFQTLTYRLTDDTTIYFKKFVIKVHSADNRQLVFTVLSDS